MKRTLKILATGSVITISSTFFVTPAVADASGNAPNQSQSFQREVSVMTADEMEARDNPGQLILVGSNGEEVIPVDDGRTVEEVIQDADLSVHRYDLGVNSDVQADSVINSGDIVTVQRKEINSDSEVVTIAKTTVEEETDDLYEGETEVRHEGEDGKALKTTLVTTSGGNETVEEKYTVVEQPQPEVVLVGTAERPEPTPTPTPSASSTPSASPSSSPSANSSPSSSASGTQSSSSSNSSSGSSSSSSTPSSSPSSSASQSSSKQEAGNHKVAQIAKAQVGKPYVWGASGPSSFDCSGLVQYAFAQAGKNVPRTTGAQWAASTPVSPSNIQVGDILWRPGHIGIYVGDGKVVHASSPSTGTIQIDLQTWLDRGMQVGRL